MLSRFQRRVTLLYRLDQWNLAAWTDASVFSHDSLCKIVFLRGFVLWAVEEPCVVLLWSPFCTLALEWASIVRLWTVVTETAKVHTSLGEV